MKTVEEWFEGAAASSYTYVGRKPCGCVVAAVVDRRERPTHTAEDVAQFIRDGYTVERVLTEAARTMLQRCRCAENAEMFDAR